MCHTRLVYALRLRRNGHAVRLHLVVWTALAAAVCLLQRGWRAEIRRRRRLRLAGELRALSYHALTDIGVPRSDIDRIVHGAPSVRTQGTSVRS